MIQVLCFLWLILAAFDAGHTIWMLKKHGIHIEMNGVIRKLCQWWGIPKGVIAGIFIPTCAIAGLCWLFKLESFLAVLVTARIILCGLQVKHQITC